MSSKKKLAAGLDLGSTSTRIVICSLDEQTVRFLGYGEAPVQQAWNKGRITDSDALVNSIRYALHQAEERANVSLESVLIGVGGTVSGVNSRGLYEFGRRREIDTDDLRYSIELAARHRIEEDRQVLQICPQDFTLDGRAGYRNPKGIIGSRLEANVHIVTFSLGEHHALISAVHQSHLAVEESVHPFCRKTVRAALRSLTLARNQPTSPFMTVKLCCLQPLFHSEAIILPVTFRGSLK